MKFFGMKDPLSKLLDNLEQGKEYNTLTKTILVSIFDSMGYVLLFAILIIILPMVLAVLEARCAIPFAGLDVYLNVAGGLKIAEPAADLAVAAALLSAREDVALPPETVIFGEISLSGALRPVGQAENRLKEAQKLGFTSAIIPAGGKVAGDGGLAVQRFGDLTALVGDIFGAG